MLSDTAKTFLEQCKLKGMDFDAVSELLSKAGWSIEQIGLAHDFFRPIVQTTQVVAPNPGSVPVIETGVNKEAFNAFNQNDLKPVTTTQIVTNNSPESFDEKPKRKIGGLKIVLVVGVLMVLLMSGTGVSAYLVATEKLKINNPNLTNAISAVVFSVPFVPKTPKFILQATSKAHEKVLKSSFDLSLAMASNDMAAALGTGSLDLQLKGYTDVSDTKNPKFSLSANVSKQFSAKAVKNDKMVYFKVDKVPVALMALVGIDTSKLDAILENWISYDSSPLETEARKSLESMEKPKTPADEAINTALEKMVNKEVLPYLVVSDDKIDSSTVYKIEFAPSDDNLDRIVTELQTQVNKSNEKNDFKIPEPKVGDTKASDVIKGLKMTLWIDKKDYYLRKGTVVLTVDPNGAKTSGVSSELMMPIPASPSSPVSVSMAVVMSDIGKEIPVETPSESITVEEFYKQIMEMAMVSSGINPTRQIAQANNTKRRSDISMLRNAVELYAADNEGKFPAGVSTTSKNISKSGADICSALIPNYMMRLPVDPALKDGDKNISECTGKYDTGYTIAKSAATGKITVTAPAAELDEVITITR